MKRRKIKIKIETPQQIRRKWIDDTLSYWSLLIRGRDKDCQWCHGSVCGSYRLQAHHIVARGISNQSSWFLLDNGMGLGFKCHIERLKQYPDEYIKFRDLWLAKRGVTYNDMRRDYQTQGKLPLDELKVLNYYLKNQCKKRELI